MADGGSTLYRDALSYARSRRVMLPDAFYALPVEARQWAFTVTGLAALDQTQQVLDNLNRALESGQTFGQWKKIALADPALGRLPADRLDTIYRTHMQQAYNIGRDVQFEQNQRARPYLMWDAINDGRARPEHAAMDGWIAPVGDADWRRWHNRVKFRCRCKRIALTQDEAVARGLNTQGAAPNVQHDPGEAQTGWREGLIRAVDARLVKCAVRAASASSGLPSWCVPGPIRDALDAIRVRLAEAPEAALERELRAGLRGERYDAALQNLRGRGVLGGPLSDAEAASLYLWSGDNAARPKPDGRFPYEVIGRTLRAMARGESSLEWDRVAAIVAGVVQALGKLPEPAVPELFRGIRMLEGEFEKAHLTPGTVVQYNSFTSFSASLDVAQEFARRGSDGWVMVVRNPRGPRDVGVYSALPRGAEFLAPLQRQYRIISVDQAAREIRIVEVPEEDRRALPAARNFSAPSPDDVVEVAPGHTMLRRYAEDPEYMAWSQDVSRRIDEVRRNPRPLTEDEELVVNHMLYG